MSLLLRLSLPPFLWAIFPNLITHAHLCLYFLPLFQIQPVLVSFLVSIKLLQLLSQGSCSLAGFFFQPVVFLHLLEIEKVVRDDQASLFSPVFSPPPQSCQNLLDSPPESSLCLDSDSPLPSVPQTPAGLSPPTASPFPTHPCHLYASYNASEHSVETSWLLPAS